MNDRVPTQGVVADAVVIGVVMLLSVALYTGGLGFYSDDWSILRALSEVLGATLPFDSFEALRAEMARAGPALGVEGLADYGWSSPRLPTGATGELASPIKDFYLTNAICRASPTMQQCSAELIHGVTYAEAAE